MKLHLRFFRGLPCTVYLRSTFLVPVAVIRAIFLLPFSRCLPLWRDSPKSQVKDIRVQLALNQKGKVRDSDAKVSLSLLLLKLGNSGFQPRKNKKCSHSRPAPSYQDPCRAGKLLLSSPNQKVLQPASQRLNTCQSQPIR